MMRFGVALDGAVMFEKLSSALPSSQNTPALRSSSGLRGLAAQGSHQAMSQKYSMNTTRWSSFLDSVLNMAL